MRAQLAAGGLLASAEIERLRRWVSLLDWQRNIFFAPFALALLWSAQIAMALERWRKRSGRHIREWIAGVGEFEALSALSGYAYENPADVFPTLVETDGGCYDAAGLGHPLMPESQCVRNDVRLDGATRLWIVSGSNMSGKSTLLRAVGLNAVLAWAGAPVRATRLDISPLAVGASIRVLDSLQDGRSRFYAEITRLREIVELARGPRAVLFLIDELLSGTNSHDRQIGAGAIVRTLIDRGAMGMITTHDLALLDHRRAIWQAVPRMFISRIRSSTAASTSTTDCGKEWWSGATRWTSCDQLAWKSRTCPAGEHRHSHDQKSESYGEEHNTPAVKQVPSAPKCLPIGRWGGLFPGCNTVVDRHQSSDRIHNRQRPQNSRRNNPDR